MSIDNKNLMQFLGSKVIERVKKMSQSRNDAQLWLYLVVKVTSDCIGTWNARSMNQGKLDVLKQEMARVNNDILGIGN